MLGAAIAFLVSFVLYVNNKPDLEIWHTRVLNSEFSAQDHVHTFDEYRQAEDRLFRELQQQIVDKVPSDRQSIINRFTPGSLSDPGRWPENWNRTYESRADNPVAGVLLLHGLSDSPYSLRNLAAHLHRKGAWVVGLRLPGHGTTPSALTDIRWQDMAAARDGVRDRQRVCLLDFLPRGRVLRFKHPSATPRADKIIDAPVDTISFRSAQAVFMSFEADRMSGASIHQNRSVPVCAWPRPMPPFWLFTLSMQPHSRQEGLGYHSVY